MIRQTDNLYAFLLDLDWEKVRPFEYAVLHSSDTEDGPNVSANAIEKWHMEHNGWSKVGYHFLVEQAPENQTKDQMTTWIGRSLYEIGAHAEGFNMKSLGVCCVGDYDQKPPDQRHWETTLYVFQLLNKFFRDKKQIDLKVLGHFEVYPLLGKPVAKTCPGKAWDMDLFRKVVKA